MANKKRSNFFIISFFPALAYWYLETYYTLEVALIGGIGLAVLEILLEKIFVKKVHTISKLNFFLIAVLGGISLLAKEGIWFKLQPFWTGLCFAFFLFYKKVKNSSLLVEMMVELNQESPVPPIVMKQVEFHLAWFLVGYSLVMLYAALYASTARWLFLKTAGFYMATFAFMIVEFFVIRFKLKSGRFQ